MHQEVGADSGQAQGRPGGFDEAPVTHQGGLDIVAAALTLGLGLAILYFGVALLGAVDPFGDSVVFTVIAFVFIALWLGAAFQRSRADTGLLTRSDRERRGF